MTHAFIPSKLDEHRSMVKKHIHGVPDLVCEVLSPSTAARDLGEKARGKQVIQLLRAVTLMARPQGATIQELERALGVHRRSVYREIETLDEVGFPLEEPEKTAENRVRHRLLPDYVWASGSAASPITPFRATQRRTSASTRCISTK